MTDRDIQNKIEKYVHGELSQPEIDNLCVEFIRDPDLFHYFETYLHLLELAKRLKKLN